jgi:hypothetical protein
VNTDSFIRHELHDTQVHGPSPSSSLSLRSSNSSASIPLPRLHPFTQLPSLHLLKTTSHPVMPPSPSSQLHEAKSRYLPPSSLRAYEIDQTYKIRKDLRNLSSAPAHKPRSLSTITRNIPPRFLPIILSIYLLVPWEVVLICSTVYADPIPNAYTIIIQIVNLGVFLLVILYNILVCRRRRIRNDGNEDSESG